MSRAWSSQIQHHPVRKQFQCKHIPDDLMICAVLLAEGVTGDSSPSVWRMRWHVETELRQLLGEHAPTGLAKVMMAKFAKLERRKILGGCSCGCRGDYHIEDPNGMCC